MKVRFPVACAAGLVVVSVGAVAQDQGLEEVVVIGSRIPRVKAEGPAPVTTISAQDIENQGLTSVPDLLKALTQNGGETQSPQSFSGADFTPGAEQVDLRGLGPNHTLVLVNGRRIADFPLPLDGLSNFTDISNIPVGMIERVEVLSGSSSAIYGSDAIAGGREFRAEERRRGRRHQLPLRHADRGRRRRLPRVVVVGGRLARQIPRGLRPRAARPASPVGVRPLDPGQCRGQSHHR
jgi:hypothetical protein